MSSANAIADAIVTAVAGLNWPGVTVVRRKKPSLPQGKDPPQVVVCVAEEGDHEELWQGSVMVTYPLVVAYVAAGGIQAGDDADKRDRREQLRRLLNADATYAAVTGFNKAATGGKDPFDSAALLKDLNHATLVARVEVIEPRS